MHISIHFYTDKWREIENTYCKCGLAVEYEEYHIGPFCAKWFTNLPPACVLMKSKVAQYCPGALKSSYGSVYLTYNDSVCNRSRREYVS